MNYNVLSIPVDKLMLWKGSWTKYDTKLSNCFLRLLHDQLLITADTNILESLNVQHKIKGIYKDDVLILIVCNSYQEIRKIKFQIKSNIAQCLEVLGRRFPIINHKTSREIRPMEMKYHNINEVLKHALELKDGNDITRTSNVPPAFNNFMKLCLLDPAFPKMVLQAENILNTEIIKTK